ncbi:MAG: hypothetical protein L0I76_08805 [Pseudonocardia sp.]|nr:hypothetical protein [Pseudonocardia sp.]
MAWSPDPDALRGRVAVVAGATRGAGRGIAAALGEAGATVVCTGRSSSAGSDAIRSDYDRVETIEETAELVTELGGVGVAVPDGTAAFNAERYRISVYYDLAKVAVNRLAFSQGHELQAHGATAVALTPGWLRSEMMLDNFGVTEDHWRDAIDGAVPGYPPAPAGFDSSESPRYVGRAVAALAADPDRGRWNQDSVTSADLAREYGFTDSDGSRPDSWARPE